MDTQLLTYLFVGASFALYIGIAIWSRAGSTNDFYVASGGVQHYPTLATSTDGVWLALSVDGVGRWLHSTDGATFADAVLPAATGAQFVQPHVEARADHAFAAGVNAFR